jgi:hypothetical protein
MKHVIATLVMICSALQSAQSHPLVGVWKVTYPWHVDVKDGVVTPVMESGEMTVEARGDSLIATIVRDNKRAIRLAALKGAADPTFTTRDSISFAAANETKRNTTVLNTWVFRASGDRLSGSLDRFVENIPINNPGPQPLSGQRVKARR